MVATSGMSALVSQKDEGHDVLWVQLGDNNVSGGWKLLELLYQDVRNLSL